MLTLSELRRVARVVEHQFLRHRVQRIVQPDPFELAIALYGPGPEGEARSRQYLLLSCRPEFARVSRLRELPVAPDTTSTFTQYLRAHCMNSRLVGASIRNDDRQLALRLRARTSEFELLLAILGKRSNLYLLDAAGNVVAASRPLDQTRRELELGEPWRDPESRVPTEGDDRWADTPDETYLVAIEETYGPLALEKRREALVRRVDQVLRREARRLDRKLEKLEKEVASGREAAELERKGELLKGVLHEVAPRARSVTARAYDTGEEVVIDLDPSQSPSANLRSYFQRYRKGVRRVAKAGAQLESIRGERRAIEGIRAALATLPGDGAAALAELERIAARDPVATMLRKYAATPKAASAGAGPRSGRARVLPRRLVPRRYRSADDLEVWVGRSDEGNDHLTTRLASARDLFFHLDGCPGSHVVLRTGGRRDAPPESVLEACELAVHFSRLREATRADVHLAPIGNVRKSKGARPGLVIVTGGKTIHLRRDRTRLERILSARIEE